MSGIFIECLIKLRVLSACPTPAFECLLQACEWAEDVKLRI